MEPGARELVDVSAFVAQMEQAHREMGEVKVVGHTGGAPFGCKRLPDLSPPSL